MSLLLLIWLASLLLATGALAIMVVLIVSRVLGSRREGLRAARRRALVQQLLRGGVSDGSALRKAPPDLIAQTFRDLIRLVRGDERDALVEQAAQLGVPARLCRLLESGSARDRLSAAQSLADFRDPGTLQALRNALDDRNEDVRLAAALSLAHSGGAAEVHALVERLGLGTEEDSMMIVTLFRTVAEERPHEIKALILRPETNVRARLAAVEALAGTGDYSLVPLIARLATEADDDSEELPRYLHALGQLGHPAGREAIIHGLNRKAPEARAAAAAAAGEIGLVESMDRLGALLDDADWWVRFRSAEALVRLGDPGLERLKRAARSGLARASEAAGTILAEHDLRP